MPNHVQNRLKIVGKKQQVEEVLNAIKGDNEVIDFNKIIPMPSELDIPSSSDGEIGLAIIKKKLGAKISPLDDIYTERFDEYAADAKERLINAGLAYLRNIIKYGYPTWCEWRKKYWNTKWNAYEAELKNNNEIWFNTAWNNVAERIVRELSMMFPNVTLKYSFSDEDVACNCGNATFKNGFGTLSFLDNNSEKAFELFKELHPQYADDYKWINGEIIYKDEE